MLLNAGERCGIVLVAYANRLLTRLLPGKDALIQLFVLLRSKQRRRRRRNHILWRHYRLVVFA